MLPVTIIKTIIMYIVIQIKQVVTFKVCKYTGVFKKRILELIKKHRDVNNFTLYRIYNRILVLRIISMMNIFTNVIPPHPTP